MIPYQLLTCCCVSMANANSCCTWYFSVTHSDTAVIGCTDCKWSHVSICQLLSLKITEIIQKSDPILHGAVLSARQNRRKLNSENNVLKVAVLYTRPAGGKHRLTLNQSKWDKSWCFCWRLMLLILCLDARLCTMTPAEAEPASGTVSSASNIWRLGITSQLRSDLLAFICFCFPPFHFVAAYYCVYLYRAFRK